MHKEMSRREFLTTVGFGLASLFGFSTVLRFLFGKGQTHGARAASGGYGSNAYGGNK